MNRVFAGLTHFQALAFFALVVSVTFGFLSKRGTLERAKYFAWTFLAFLAVAIGIGLLMYPFSR
jgi:cytochrome bd-type quinol oxidase subunit 2